MLLCFVGLGIGLANEFSPEFCIEHIPFGSQNTVGQGRKIATTE
jgi:hypothetical protein